MQFAIGTTLSLLNHGNVAMSWLNFLSYLSLPQDHGYMDARDCNPIIYACMYDQLTPSNLEDSKMSWSYS